MALSAAPSPTAPSVSADEAIAAAAQWSAPLLRDVLTIELLDEDLEATALGVALTCLALLEEHTLPGWLPGLLDEQRCPLSGPVSFCFTEDHGAVPIGVVRSTPDATRSSSRAHIDLPTCSLVLQPIRRGTCNPQMHQYVLLLVARLRMTVGELVMAYACVERVLVLHPTTMRVNSIRPMLLGACVIASKTSRDGDLGLREVNPPPQTLPASFLALHLSHPPRTPGSSKRNSTTFSTSRWLCSPPSSSRCSRCAALELLTQS